MSVRTPSSGDVPFCLDSLVDERVVVLKAGTDALFCERSPDGALKDSLTIIGPELEVGGVRGVRLLGLVYDRRIGEVQDGSVARLFSGEHQSWSRTFAGVTGEREGLTAKAPLMWASDPVKRSAGSFLRRASTTIDQSFLWLL